MTVRAYRLYQVRCDECPGLAYDFDRKDRADAFIGKHRRWHEVRNRPRCPVGHEQKHINKAGWSDKYRTQTWLCYLCSKKFLVIDGRSIFRRGKGERILPSDERI